MFDGEEFGQGIVDSVKAYVDRTIDARCAALEMKVARLEATLELRNFSYMGTFKEGKIYNPGSFVTFSGALWHCNQFHTTTRPGDGDAAWTLAVKSGRDGKDAASGR